MPAAHVESRVSHYRLEELIGSGGMGMVYRALDERLGRRVALKFLSAGSAGEAARQQFLQEARAASALDHPNICTVFDVDETPDGGTFIVMPWYEGETLDQVVARGPLPAERALGIVAQIARGLAAAHEAGIVHRDVKPGNVVLMARDTVKILDFGLAKLPGPRAAGEPGGIVGTPSYMAPEQVRGEEVDRRADIWAVGAVLYELVTGRRPFPGQTVQAVITAVLRDEPAPPSELVPGLSAKLDRVVARALAKSRELRYQRMEQLVDELLALRADLDPSGITAWRAPVPRSLSLAVLPFVDLSPDRSQEYLCDGIAEELLSALRRLPDLFVASRTSAFQFKGKAVDVREVGARLNVGHVLEGSVRRAGERVRVTVQLVGADDGYRLWHERYDRRMEDIFAIEEEIAERIATALSVTFTAGRRGAAARLSPEQAEAYELYLQGLQFFRQHRRKAFEIALQQFTRAIELDPHSARAYAGIADCNSFLKLYFGQGPERASAAEEASRKALELAPELAEAHTARGLALFVSGALAEAEPELARAVELDRLLYEAQYIYGRVCFSQGRIDEAARHFRDAVAADPDAYDSWYLLGMCCRRQGDLKRARAADLECLEAVSKRVRLHPDDTRAWTMGASVFAELGEPDRAASWVARARAIDPDEPIILYNAACVYAALGRPDEAISCLEVPVLRQALSRAWVENDPDLDSLRAHPRFRALLERAAAA